MRCLGDISLISRQQFGELFRVKRHSAPGPDGITYAAWNHANEAGVDLLYRCLGHLVAGNYAPIWFNGSLMVSIPKNSDGIASSVECQPADLRPLTLSNSDQKLLSL
eukprot:9711668-Heterocapsa_arctica.AAC.1